MNDCTNIEKSNLFKVMMWSVIYFIVLLCINEILRRSTYAGWFIFGLVPIITPFFFKEHFNKDRIFFWVKTYSVVAVAATIVITKQFLNSPPYEIWPIIFIVLLVLNILEAAISDALRKKYLNVIVATILLVTIPSPDLMSIADNTTQDVLYKGPFLWFTFFTIWNFTFIWNRSYTFVAIHAPILLGAILLEIFQEGIWGQTRAFILGFHQIFHLYLRKFFDKTIYIKGRDDQFSRGGKILEIISIGFAMFYIFYFIKYLN